MEFDDDILRIRKMIRKCPPQWSSRWIINKLIKNIDRSPSAGHIEVQEFITVKDPAIKKKLRRLL